MVGPHAAKQTDFLIEALKHSRLAKHNAEHAAKHVSRQIEKLCRSPELEYGHCRLTTQHRVRLESEVDHIDTNQMPSSDSEPELGAFGLSEDLVQSPSHKPATTKQVDFDGLLAPPLTLHEDLAEGNGGQAWPAGMILTKYLLRRKREELQHGSIVELGAGGGLTGLAIAVGCRRNIPIHVTDMQSMLPLMQRNIYLNGLESQVKASVYDWGNAQPDGIPQHPDVVLAADCVYFEPAFPLLQSTLQDLIGPNTVCYFCFKRRRRADMHFLKAVKKMFLVEDVSDDPDQPSYSRDNIFL